MLPIAHPFTAADADRWVRAGVPRWVTNIALPGLWLCAIVVAFASDSARCAPQDPSVCGPDSHFALWVVVCLATPVLLWWMPVLGCSAGVAFALADLRYDDVQAARWAFGLHGLLCALVAVRLVWGSVEQRRIAGAASAGGRSGAVPDLPGGPGRSAVPRFVVAGLLVLAGLGFFAWYGHEVAGERAHLRRAVQVQAKILAVDPDWSIRVEARTPAAGTREYTIGVYNYTDPYPMHSSTPVLVDPQDPDWIRLVAEPRDSTGWQTAGAGCFALAFCLLLHWRSWRRDLRALGSGEHPALCVRIRPDDKGRALVLPALDSHCGPDGDRPFARLAVFEAPPSALPEGGVPASRWDEPDDWRHVIRAAFVPLWFEEAPADVEWFARPPGHVEPSGLVENAVLIGELRDHGVAMLVTADAVLLPTGRLRAGRVRGGQPPHPPGELPGGRLRAGRVRGGQPPHPPGELPDPAPHRLHPLRRGRLNRRRAAAKDKLFTGIPVQLASLQQPLQLPITARSSARNRVIGLLMVLGGFIGCPVAGYLAHPDLFGLALIAWTGSIPVEIGAARLFSYLRLDHHRFEITDRWATHSVPWDQLHGVRRRGQAVSIAWEPDVVIVAGPFDDPAGELRPQDWTEQLGAMMLLQQERALLGGLPDHRLRSRPSMALAVLAAYAALVVVVAVVR